MPLGGQTANMTFMADPKKRTLKVLVYSSDERTRARVRDLLGTRPTAELPAIELIEVATEPVVVQHMDSGQLDLAILDGEAVPAGGMGIARQMKDEVYRCPPILVMVARKADAWLATWSRADAVTSGRLDPLEFPEIVASLLRRRIAVAPAR